MCAVGGETLFVLLAQTADATFLVKPDDGDAHAVGAFLNDVARAADVVVGDGCRLHGGEQYDLCVGKGVGKHFASVAHGFGQAEHGGRVAMDCRTVGGEGLLWTYVEQSGAMLREPCVVGAEGYEDDVGRWLCAALAGFLEAYNLVVCYVVVAEHGGVLLRV